jgi:hypothetical protein
MLPFFGRLSLLILSTCSIGSIGKTRKIPTINGAASMLAVHAPGSAAALAASQSVRDDCRMCLSFKDLQQKKMNRQGRQERQGNPQTSLISTRIARWRFGG